MNDPKTLGASDIMRLQRFVGNSSVARLFSGSPARGDRSGLADLVMQRVSEPTALTSDSQLRKYSTTTDRSGKTDVLVQRVGGATPHKFKTDHLKANSPREGSIDHKMSWASSSGRMEDLSDVSTREKVVFDRPPGEFMPAYDVYALMADNVRMEGSTLYKEGVKGSKGTAGDIHSPGYGPYFDAVSGFIKKAGVLSAVQTYQYQNPDSGDWNDIKGSQFTIVRTMAQAGMLGLWRWNLTTKKDGPGASATAQVRVYDSKAACPDNLKG